MDATRRGHPLLHLLLPEEVPLVQIRRQGVYGTVGVDVRLRVSSARRVEGCVVEVNEVDGRRRRRPGQRLAAPVAVLVLVVLALPVVLRLVYEEEDGADAGDLGAYEAAHVEDERVAVGVVEGGREDLGAGTKLAAHLRLEDRDVHDQAEEHHEPCNVVSGCI